MENESPAKAPLTRVDPTTYKPVTGGRLHSNTPLHGHTREEKMEVWPPDEQTSNHDDACLSIMEERVALHLEPLDPDRLLRVCETPTGRSFHSLIGEPTPRHLPMPQWPGSHRTLLFHHAAQPVSPPAVVGHLVPPLPRILVEKPFGVGSRVEVLRDRTPKYSGDRRGALKNFWRKNAKTHEPLVKIVPHELL